MHDMPCETRTHTTSNGNSYNNIASPFHLYWLTHSLRNAPVAASFAPGQPARPVPSYRLRNGSYRGFWQADWPKSTEKNCSWPCHRQRLVGLTGTESTVIGAGSWEVIPTGQLGQALPLVWKEQTPNVENPVVIPSTDGKEFLVRRDGSSI